MSSIKDRIASVASRSPRSSVDEPSGPTDQEANKYRLLVTAGPSYDTSRHKIVHVNTAKPTVVENDFLTASIKVRIRGYRGLPSHSPSSSAYFDDPGHTKDQYSIAFSFIPKIDLPSVDTVWGNDFDHPVRDRLPPGFNTAFKIVKEFIDPGLECDAYADEPWLYGPSLSCWFAFGLGDQSDGSDLEREKAEPDDVLKEGADSDEGWTIRRELGMPENSEKRRKHFLSRENRQPFVFEKGRTYRGDFYNPYLDFGNFALKLPGFSIRVIKYIDEKSHRLRYVFKNRKTGDVYFCVNLNLLWGEQLKAALEDEQKEIEKHAGAEAEKRTIEVNGHEGADEDVRPPVRCDENQGSSPCTSGEDESKAQIERKGSEQCVPVEPGLADKPPHLVEEAKKMSIQDTLESTASANKSQGRSGVLGNELG